MKGYILTKTDIASMEGTKKVHFMNNKARRTNWSLGDLTGLKGLGFHIIEVPPGAWSTEKHVHYFEDECLYILSGQAEATIGDEVFDVSEGDFIGYRAGGLPHSLYNSGSEVLRCIVVGQRLAHDVADYTDRGQRIFRNEGMDWNLVPHDALAKPEAGEK
ncbi:cupin domain-containing protein [Kiloniella sp. b19]|uniref:cupin domain-containing protein n=1 Tax=Kiloniella sp. GXU_MW_B19 TaxID=3141326 RepID=UPI0031DFBAA0